MTTRWWRSAGLIGLLCVGCDDGGGPVFTADMNPADGGLDMDVGGAGDCGDGGMGDGGDCGGGVGGDAGRPPLACPGVWLADPPNVAGLVLGPNQINNGASGCLQAFGGVQ